MAKDRELKTPRTVVIAASQRRLKGQGLSKKLSLNSGSSISDLTTDYKAYAAMVRAAAG
jgi:hypothetical protein